MCCIRVQSIFPSTNYPKGNQMKPHTPFITTTLLLLTAPTLADDWPQWRGPTADGVWHETSIVDTLPAPRISLSWKVPISSGYSGPTVADGRVFVTDRITKPRQSERIHCFAWDTGELLWSREYESPYRNVSFPAGPRACVVVHDGLAYALGTMGHLHCLEAATGRIVWHKDLNALYQIRMPVWGISASPVIYDDLVILQISGSDNACLVALDRRTGAEKWRALDDEAGYSTPIFIEQAGRPVLACWTAENVVGLDPSSGQVYWKYPFLPLTGSKMAVASPVYDTSRLFVTGFFDGALMLRLGSDRLEVEKLWRRHGASELKTDALHSAISTPILLGDYIYGIGSYGEFRCLEAATGDRVWENLEIVPRARWGTAHFVRNGDRFWIFNERGELLIATLSPDGPVIHSRSHLIDPTTDQLNQRGGVTWSHPAFAYGHIFARNDRELVCASLVQQ